MTTDEVRPTMHVPARDIPVPTSVSAEAQAILAAGPLMPPTEWPPLDDLDGWRAVVAARDAMVPDDAPTMMVASLTGAVETGVGAEVEVVDVNGVDVYVATPDGVSPDDRRVYLGIHGGAWIAGGGKLCGLGAALQAGTLGARVWAVDYRLLPDHPHPAPLDDCVAAYRGLLAEHRPEDIVVGGLSAGAHLAAAMLLRARDEGLPLPAAAVLATPGVDLTMSGDTMRTNSGVDTSLNDDIHPIAALYTGAHDPKDPYISPVFGDFSQGFPPTLLTSGTRDFLLSDTVRLHRKLRAADIPAELHVFEAAPHAMFLGTAPEDRERAREIRRFAEEHWGA